MQGAHIDSHPGPDLPPLVHPVLILAALHQDHLLREAAIINLLGKKLVTGPMEFQGVARLGHEAFTVLIALIQVPKTILKVHRLRHIYSALRV